MTPGFGAWSAYAADPVQNPYAGLTDPGFLASFGQCLIRSINTETDAGFTAWFFLCMALFSLIGTICALRTNIPNVICFLFLLIQYCLLCGCYWVRANGQAALGDRVQVVCVFSVRCKLEMLTGAQQAAGAAGIVVVSSGWYLFAALLLEGADAPLQLPVGELSKVFGSNWKIHAKEIGEAC